MPPVLHHIPLDYLPSAPPGPLILRAEDAEALIAALAAVEPTRIAALHWKISLDSELLNAWAPGLFIELRMLHPAEEFPLLYRHVNLLERHPVRVIIPVQPGFAKAVKTAVALDFAVRLQPGQPSSALVDELASVLDLYLRQPTVAQPIEYFHSTLQSFYRQQAVPLWRVLDEDPTVVRWVDEGGSVSFYGPLAGLSTTAVPDRDCGLEEWIDRFLATEAECRSCPFRPQCGGYFKWPDATYKCAGTKRLFSELKNAAEELQRDLAAFAEVTKR